MRGALAHLRFLIAASRVMADPVTLEDAKRSFRERIERRTDSLLEVMDRAVFGTRSSPYRRLLEVTGWSQRDVHDVVGRSGVESALRELKDSGVYVTFDEFKGRQPLIRNGERIDVRASDFWNPFLTSYFSSSTSGSTGPPARTFFDVGFVRLIAEERVIYYDAFGLWDAPVAIWRPTPPTPTGMANVLSSTMAGKPIERWFAVPVPRKLGARINGSLATWGLYLAGAVRGIPVPRPEPVPTDRAEVVVRWAAEEARAAGRSMVNTGVSNALRLATAAEEAGIALTGVTIRGGGEPATRAKAERIARTGAHWVTEYNMGEAGRVATACSNPRYHDDMHVMSDRLALLEGDETGARGARRLVLTTLTLSSPTIMLNVDTGDSGIVGRNSCGCPWEQLGLTQQVRGVFSEAKLTGEGFAIAGTEMLNVLEVVLPSRFGGNPTDYQLVEEEDAGGFTRLVLTVSPRLGELDEDALVEAVFSALGTSNFADEVRGLWGRAGTLRIRRSEPFVTESGKVAPLHVERMGQRR